jgi:predicted dienelactone hydrolase
MSTRLIALAFLLAGFVVCPAFATPAFRQVTVAATGDLPPLQVSLWYPTGSTAAPTILGETPAFFGLPVIRDAAPAPGPHPLVLLSHGYGGSWRNLAWLAGTLAAKGYVVAAPDHPGTTTFDMQPPDTVALWRRPGDISRALDVLLAQPALTGGIAPGRIAAIGHSLGGWTVMELAGARFDADVVTKNCLPVFGAIYCKTFAAMGVGRDAAAVAALEADLSDSRIKAIITLDLGPGRGLTPESLAAIAVPVLVLGASQDVEQDTAEKASIAATNKDSVYLAEHLPQQMTQFSLVPGTLHFSFMQLCKPGAAALIEEEAPGESIVCRDVVGADRDAIHRRVGDTIMSFLTGAI